MWNDIKPFVDSGAFGEGTWSEELPLVMTRNGFPEQTYWTFSYSPLYDGGKIVGMINVASDATPTVVAREREAALHNEMIHRLKNTLAVASAIVSSTLRNASDLNEARTIVIDRINALGRAQDLLHGDAREVSMREMIGVALSAHIDHPDVSISTDPTSRSPPKGNRVVSGCVRISHELGEIRGSIERQRKSLRFLELE